MRASFPYILGWLCVFGVTLTLRAAPAVASPEEDFRAGEDAFRYQNYELAVKTLEALIYPSLRLSDPQEIVRAREYLAASYWWLDRKEAAEEEFIALLAVDPEHELDAFYHPPPLLQFYADIRDKLVRLGVIRKNNPGDTVPTPVGPSRTLVRTVEKHPFVMNLVPFGVGQFENGDTTAGVLFLVGESLSLASTIATYFLILDFRKEDPERARAFETALWASQGVFWGLVVGGITHASLRWEPETVSEKWEELPTPLPTLGGSSLRPGLALTPDPGIFVGLGGSF